MNNQSEVTRTKFDPSDLFIKFIDKQYIDSFLNEGCLHFETFNKFQELDGNQSGDPNEGRIAFDAKDAFVIGKSSVNEEYKLLPLKTTQFKLYNPNVQGFGLTSMFHVSQYDGLFLTDIQSQNCDYVAKINPNVLADFKPFLESAENQNKEPVIIFAQQFIQRVLNYKEDIATDDVHYYDRNYPTTLINAQEDLALKTLFMKTMEYSHQKEYRLVLPRNINPDGENITLGRLSDIAVRLEFKDLENVGMLLNTKKDSTNI